MNTCEHCGTQFEPNKLHPRQRFCSDLCNSRWKRENPDKIAHYTFTCKYCLKEYLTIHKERNQYCSRECAYAVFRKWSKTPQKIDRPIKVPIVKVCVTCGNEFFSWQRKTRFCSSKCHVINVLESAKNNRTIYKKHCRVCHKTFETRHPAQNHCSMTCLQITRSIRRQEGKDRRRALKKKAFVERVSREKIFERDHWICGICGEPVDQSLKFPDLKSPSLDHIIPLAKNGTHEISNVQLAHFICNAHKGANVNQEDG